MLWYTDRKWKAVTNMGYLIAVLLGYLLGCSNMAWYLAKWYQADFRENGSGNLGASNATMLLGLKAGVLTALHDIGKSALAVLLAKWLFPELENAGVIAGVASVLGHVFPFWLKFKGGKGFASYFGTTLALNWRLALVVAAAVILVALVTDYIVCGTMTTIVSVPVYMFFTSGALAAAILCIGTAVIIWKHRENFPRMLNGTEFRVRSALRGEKRLDKEKDRQ